MAEQLSMRQVKLASGVTLLYDGSTLTVTSDGGAETKIAVAGDEQDALIWLIRGQRQRRTGKPSTRKGPKVTEPSAGAVPAA